MEEKTEKYRHIQVTIEKLINA